MSNKVLIIAEVGVNHNGSLEIAKKLIDISSEAGVDVVKFQSFKPDQLTSTFAPKADYQIANTGSKESQLEMLKKLSLTESEHKELVIYCKSKGVRYCSSPFDIDSIEFLSELNIPFWKIASGEITNLPFLRKIAKYNKPVILSTGMSTLGEIESAMEVLTNNGLSRDHITLLHCNTEYPTPVEDVNLNCMNTLKNAFGVKVGFSDHTVGIEFPIAAAALGATVIEKHITLDCKMSGPDHKASIEPEEIKKMVLFIRNVEKGLGSSIKKPTESERKNINIARKSIVAKVNISEGDLLTEENITVKRPGSGISPMLWDTVIGQKAIRNFLKDECIGIY